MVNSNNPTAAARRWLSTGLKVLAELGAPGITIGELCQRLNLSKGSFYHHFSSREGFIRELLAYWESEMTDRVIALTRKEDSKLKKLSELTAGIAAGPVEPAIRAWAAQNSEVDEVLRRVDQRRVHHLATLLQSLEVADHKFMARMLYATYLGAQQLRPRPSKQDIRRMFDRVTAHL